MISADITKVLLEISKFCYTKKNRCIDCILIHSIVSNSKDFFDKKVTMLMMSAKVATPGLLKITLYWNKGYDVITCVYDITNKFFSRDSNYIVNVVM